jgi:hypothetical protein
MKIALDTVQAVTSNASPANAQSSRVVRESAPAPGPDTSAASQAALPAGIAQPAVTFRKDSAGKIYYVVSDPQSGKEIRQIPADAFRKVSEGIDEFLRQLEAKQNSHVEVKA